MASRIVGVSIEGNSIKAAEVRSRLGRTSAGAAATIDLPPGAVDWGAVLEPDVVADALRELWSTAGFKTRNIVMTLDGRLALTRQTEIPVLSEQAYRQALRYDLAELVPYTPDEAVIDYIEMAEWTDDDGHKQRASIAIAVRDQTLESLRTVTRAAGLTIVRFDLPALALDRIVEPIEGTGAAPIADDEADPDLDQRDDVDEPHSPAAPEEPAELLVHVEADTTTIVVRTAAGVQCLRTLPVGAGADAGSLASELEAQLQTILEHENLGDKRTVEGERDGSRHAVAEGLRGTLEYVATIHPDLDIARLHLSGSEDEETLRTIVGDPGIPIRTAEPSLAWAGDDGGHLPFLLAAGAATAQIGSPDRSSSLDLETDVERQSSAIRNQWLAGVGVAALLAVALGFDGSGRWADLQIAEEEADRAEEALALAELQALELDETKAVHADYTRLTGLMDQALAGDLDLVGVVDALATGLPADAELTSLSVRSGETFSLVPPDEDLGEPVGRVDLVGRSPGHVAVADWLRAFEKVDHLDGEEISGSALELGELDGASGFSGSAVIVDDARWDRGVLYGLEPLPEPADDGPAEP